MTDERWKWYGTERNWKIYDRRQKGYTFAQIGREFGLSRDRVWTVVTILERRLQEGSIRKYQITTKPRPSKNSS